MELKGTAKSNPQICQIFTRIICSSLVMGVGVGVQGDHESLYLGSRSEKGSGFENSRAWPPYIYEYNYIHIYEW